MEEPFRSTNAVLQNKLRKSGEPYNKYEKQKKTAMRYQKHPAYMHYVCIPSKNTTLLPAYSLRLRSIMTNEVKVSSSKKSNAFVQDENEADIFLKN